MERNFFIKFSLWKKFTVALLFFAILLLVATSSISYITNMTSASNDLKEKLDVMTELAAMAFIDPLWNYNTTASIANGDALMKDKEICLVDVKDSEGKEVYNKTKDSKLTTERNIIVLEKDIFQGEQNIGHIKIGITKYYRVEALRRDLSVNILLTAILALIIGVLITYLIVQSITKPINQIVADLTEGANQTAAASSQLATASQQLSQGSTEQASSIEETSSILQESASMSQQNNVNIRQASQLSGETKEAAENGNQQMQEMMNAIDEMKKSGDRIAKIIKVIDDIAFQTNILALNAAVEAARAGEAGMGFAVVAEEVRNLAGRSAQAAKDTTAMIENNIELSANGVSVAERVRDALMEITVQANKVSELMAEVTAASQEQTQGLEQVNKAIVQMENITQQNATNAEESAATSGELSIQAQNLRKITQQLSQLVNGKEKRSEELVNNYHNNLISTQSNKRNILANRNQTDLLESSDRRSGYSSGKDNIKTKVVSPEDVIPLDKDNKF